jgi:hypothetical protein
VYNQQREKVEPAELEAIMVLTNEWIEEGRAAGLQESRQILGKVARHLLASKGIDISLLLDRLDRLDGAQLQQLVDRLVDSTVPFDADAWLKQID